MKVKLLKKLRKRANDDIRSKECECQSAFYITNDITFWYPGTDMKWNYFYSSKFDSESQFKEAKSELANFKRQYILRLVAKKRK